MKRMSQSSIAWIVMLMSIATSAFMIWFLVTTDKSVALKLDTFEQTLSNIKPVNGKDVTLDQVAEAVGKYCEQRDNCSGLHGLDSKIPGPAGSPSTVPGPIGGNGYTPIKGIDYFDGITPPCYFTESQCVGNTGNEGQTGPAGRTLEQRCVVIDPNTRRIEQKYTDAEDWDVLYYLSTGQTCPQENT